MAFIKLKGKELKVEKSQDLGHFKLSKSYTLKLDRSSGEDLEAEVNDTDIAQIIFEDNVEWIGNVQDVNEIFAQTFKRSNDSNKIIIPSAIHSGNVRSGLNFSPVKLFNLFVKPEDIAKNIALIADKKIMPDPGLYVVDRNFNLNPYTENSLNKEKTLLLLHGTISDTNGSFGGLKRDLWTEIYDNYDIVLTLQHYTLSISPLQNALDVLELLPKETKLDILSHSRGGLIADILARCDWRNDNIGFTDDESELLSKQKEIVQKIITKADDKKVEIGKVIRVACPAGGTTLLSSRLDHFLNAILNAVGLAFGSKSNYVYDVVREFLMSVIAQKSNVESIPGLWSMVPESEFQRVNNNRRFVVKSRLYVIAGDGKIGGSFSNTLKVILSNLFYLAENDFVVNTKSMKRGLSRESGVYLYTSKDNKTSHFNYFENENSRNIIKLALNSSFDNRGNIFKLITSSQMDRGVDLSFGFNPYFKNKISGHKPIVILLPGIMGSTLKEDDEIWLNFLEIGRGNFVNKLNHDFPSISTSGLLEKYYKQLGEYLSPSYDVFTFPFDWRKTISETGKELQNALNGFEQYSQPIKIIAHSMGGLVVRQMMLENREWWISFQRLHNVRLLLLGTPWHGSHLILEVLTGHSRRVKQIALLDMKHSKKKILDVISEFPGIYELLPINHQAFEKKEFWENIQDVVGKENMTLPNQRLLENFGKYKKSIAELNTDQIDIAFDNIYYIAGKGETVCDYTIKNSFFKGDYLSYLTTQRGDGSVTWELGIPTGMNKKNIYYCNTIHGNLANDPEIFRAITDILENGTTFRLPQEPPAVRSSDILYEKTEYDFFDSDYDSVFDNLMNDSDKVKADVQYQHSINVSILNGDLKFGKFPVMVGHFLNDGIYSAEKVLDRYLNSKLSERHRLGFYPGEIGESEVTYHKSSQPKGALIVGMGKQGELTPYLLSNSIEKAVIKYAFFFRDNYEDIEIKKKGCGITTVFIGSSFAGLKLSESINAILTGVNNANIKIKALDNGLMPVMDIQFVDHFEDVAQQSFKILKDIEGNSSHLQIKVTKFESGNGSRRRIQVNDNASWWHTFTAVSKFKNDGDRYLNRIPIGLAYSSSGGKARVEQNDIQSDLKIVEYLSKEFSHTEVWDKKLAKTMFELLVPNDFKSVIRNQSNIIWKMDEYAAQFPWEMFHDFNFGYEPTFINTGLIRQLYADNYRVNPVIVDAPSAIVIGDPDYSGSNFGQLPGAAAEAASVHNILVENGFDSLPLIYRNNASEIIKELYSADFKVMHFAAHGVYDNENVGIVLGPETFLTPGTLEQLSAIPEFIFVNCCFSGSTFALNENFYKERSKLASNIGTQLIRMGVKAVVVTGWAVNDSAAKVFADELYRCLLSGHEFGISVRKARRKCYDDYPNSSTWGAYQCYGDHYYKLVNKNPDSQSQETYIMESQVEVDLDNVLSRIRGQKVNIAATLKSVDRIHKDAVNSGMNTASISEKYAFIFAELGQYDKAIDILEELKEVEEAGFSVAALEQYCSLRSKQIVKHFRNDQNYPSISDVINDLKIIKFIGETSERLALIGSAYKRAAVINAKKIQSRNKYLNQMRINFYEAWEKRMNGEFIKTVYPLTNYILATLFLRGPAESEKEFGEKLIYPGLGQYRTYFKDQKKKIENSSADKSVFFNATALTKILLCEYLFESDVDQAKKIYQELWDSMLNAIRDYGNIKNINGEVEHLDFIMDMLSDQTKINELRRLKLELETFLTYGE
ncbi:MAG: CHAT domain-containing protein [Saprospiraceae bacterium]|nr:CHAT domain-containing protein [Saprospiraceae bacterium]